MNGLIWLNYLLCFIVRERDILAQEELCRTGMPMLEQDGGSHSRGGNSNRDDELFSYLSDPTDLSSLIADDYGNGPQDHV